jgi:hypothetical protein
MTEQGVAISHLTSTQHQGLDGLLGSSCCGIAAAAVGAAAGDQRQQLLQASDVLLRGSTSQVTQTGDPVRTGLRLNMGTRGA